MRDTESMLHDIECYDKREQSRKVFQEILTV